MVLVIVSIVGEAVLDDVPYSQRLEVYFHDQCPLRVIRPG